MDLNNFCVKNTDDDQFRHLIDWLNGMNDFNLTGRAWDYYGVREGKPDYNDEPFAPIVTLDQWELAVNPPEYGEKIVVWDDDEGQFPLVMELIAYIPKHSHPYIVQAFQRTLCYKHARRLHKEPIKGDINPPIGITDVTFIEINGKKYKLVEV